ncbi:MAG: hypothetical protein J7M19_00720 [Planctomycetes bacterium]|nr:hypothetical protein [Planctomycetota bacterium]
MTHKQPKEPSRILILVSLFLIRGPLGLGMLWKSERFEPGEKKLLTLMVIVYTLIIAVAILVAGKLVLTYLGADFIL